MNTFGLNDEQVIRSREEHGSNRLTEQKKESFFHKLMGNFGDPMIKILCVALLLNLIFVFLHYFAGIGDTEWYETAGIAAAVLIATIVSTVSEYKNESAFQKLQQEASAIRCKVFRSGQAVEIPIDEIVTGDAVLLQSGDRIPADGHIIEGRITVDQSALNGETKEAPKAPVPGPHPDAKPDLLDGYSVFRGSVVNSGSGIMTVTVVGDRSVYGQIAGELQIEDDRPSPLKHKLSKLAGAISRFGYFGGAAIAVVYLIQSVFFCTGGVEAYFSAPELWLNMMKDIIQAVMFAVIIIVMAVPEGLPLMIAIVSSMNMKKMLRDNVLVRKVSGIETAGSLNILFSDKTGTITKGRLETVLFMDGMGRTAERVEDIDDQLASLLALSLYHNTDAVMSRTEKELSVIGGNPTDRALLSFVSNTPDPFPKLKKLKTIPFQSESKFSATAVSSERTVTLIKGAPEKLIGRCAFCYDGQGLKIPFDPNRINKEIDRLAEKAIRVLAVAISDTVPENNELPGGSWTLVGILGIRDEVRPESVDAIKQVTEAGIQVVMITGDRRETAVAIAKDAGLLKNDDDIVLTSDELSSMTDEKIKSLLPRIRVIARALPSDKTRLVRLSQELDLVVGMTGDGVNDSPALKKADVGFAMGSGTEVAKEAGDIVILDDNFLSISRSVLYGRTIFNNIRKFISFQLVINLSAVLISFIMPLLGLSNPLSITQILWVNLVMDTLAALAFGGEPALERYMSEAPRRRDENIISLEMRSRLIVDTIWIFLLSLFLLISPLWTGSPVWWFVRSDHYAQNSHEYYPYLMTAYFTFFILTAVFNSLNVRSTRLNLFEHISLNKTYFMIMSLIILTQIILVQFGGELFSCHGLTPMEWLFVVLLSLTIIPVDLIRKLVRGSLSTDKSV